MDENGSFTQSLILFNSILLAAPFILFSICVRFLHPDVPNICNDLRYILHIWSLSDHWLHGGHLTVDMDRVSCHLTVDWMVLP